MSAFWCQNCDELSEPSTGQDLFGKIVCEDCYAAHLCECGAEVKEEGDLCESCVWMMDK